jgi:hypothetical protein
VAAFRNIFHRNPPVLYCLPMKIIVIQSHSVKLLAEFIKYRRFLCASSSTNHQIYRYFFPAGRMFGDKCPMDYECAKELNLICSRNEPKTCDCRRGYMWNTINKICYLYDGHHYDNGTQLRASFPLEAFKIPTTGPLFCLTNIIYRPPLFRRRCGPSDEWATLTR